MSEPIYITLPETLKILGSSKPKFYRVYYKRLTLYKDESNYRGFYSQSEVQELKKIADQEEAKRLKMIKPKKVRDAIQ